MTDNANTNTTLSPPPVPANPGYNGNDNIHSVRVQKLAAMATGSVHGYTLYNKKDNQGSLIGNWVEERSLKDMTGVFRYKPWVSETTQTTTVYPDRAGGDFMPTFRRVFEHTEALDPADWTTHNQATHQKPDQRVGDLRTYVEEPETGVRGSARASKLQEEALSEPHEPFPVMDGETNYMGTFGVSAQMAVDAQQKGQRVMMTPDLAEQVQQDPTFLGESGILDKSFAMRTEADAPSAAGTSVPYYSDEAITLHSAKRERKTFFRDTTFTTPMTDPRKIVINE